MTIGISESNPWASGKPYIIEGNQILLMRRPYKYLPSDGDRFYTVKAGDVIHKIANEFYKDEVSEPWLWGHIIADANNIIDHDDLTLFVGKQIVIPNILIAAIERFQ